MFLQWWLMQIYKSILKSLLQFGYFQKEMILTYNYNLPWIIDNECVWFVMQSNKEYFDKQKEKSKQWKNRTFQ